MKLHEVSLKFHGKFQIVKLPSPSPPFIVLHSTLVSRQRCGKNLNGVSGASWLTDPQCRHKSRGRLALRVQQADSASLSVSDV